MSDDKLVDYDAIYPFVIHLSKSGWARLKTPDSLSSKRIASESDLIKFMTSSKHKFTICTAADLNCLLKVLSEKQLLDLVVIGETHIHGGGKLQLRRNKLLYEKNSKFYSLWNIAESLKPNVYKKFDTENLDHIGTLVAMQQVNNIQNSIPTESFSSVAQNARAYALQDPDFRQECWKVYFWGTHYFEMLDAFYKSARQAPQLSSIVGTFEGESWDMVRSHNSILKYAPGISNCKVTKGLPFTEEAAYGTYLIDTINPAGRFSIPLLPRLIESKPRVDFGESDLLGSGIGYRERLTYTGGKVKNLWVSKPFIDALNYFHIPWQLKDNESWQLIPNGGNITYPHKNLCNARNLIMDKDSSIIRNKPLYQTIVGSMVYILNIVSPETTEEKYIASSTFMPMTAGFVYANQYLFTWWQSVFNDPNVPALRSDAITAFKGKFKQTACPFLPNSEHFAMTKRSEGAHMFINPYLKAFKELDGTMKGEVYNDIVATYHNKPYGREEFETRTNLGPSMYFPRELGNLGLRIIRIAAGTNQSWELDKVVKHLQELKDGSIRAHQNPNIPYNDNIGDTFL